MLGGEGTGGEEPEVCENKSHFLKKVMRSPPRARVTSS